MADDFGTKQTRVLDVDGRSLDNVVFLTGAVPLTSEWNLINQISNSKAQDAARVLTPSGWLRVGSVSGTLSEAAAQSGDVLASETYDANTFKIVSTGGNVAVVNGWRIFVQGWNSPDNNNVVELDTAGGQRYDFVFLEVWRKLVTYRDSLYPYGNVSKIPYTDNEILWSATGIETSMRVQVQYRIRSIPVATVLSGSSDVFSDVDVHPIGGRTTGEYAFSKFSLFDADDAGLYRTGDGSVDSQVNLGTVDGYVYAIPMFLVYRRIPSASVFSPTAINYGYTTASRLSDGYVKDRPDGLLSDCVYAQDIVDFRHHVVSSTSDINDIVKCTLAKLVAGDLSTALKSGYDQDGQLSPSSSGGSILTKAERINSTGSDNIPNMGTGDSFRRAFCNSAVTTNHCVAQVSFNGSGQWASGTIALSSIVAKSYGSVTSVDGVYSTDLGALVTGVTYSTSDITISSGSNLVGQSCNLYIEFTFTYSASDSGFKDVPRTVLEASKGSFSPISLGREIAVRFNNAGALLNFGLTPNAGDTTENDYVVNRGGVYTESYNYGHDLVVYRTTNGSSIVSISLTSGTLNGYYVLGVKRVRVKSGSSYGDPVTFSVSRSVTVGPPYVIDGFTVTAAGNPNADVEITLITGSKPSNDSGEAYDLTASMKFFEVNKQGRGVIDCFEMIDVVADEDIPANPGSYVVDTTSLGKPIIALGTKSYMSAGYEVGDPQAYRHDTGAFVTITTTSPNISLPVLNSSAYSADWLPTRVVVTATPGLSKIRIPVLVHAAPTSTESPYTFFYEMTPYQGILSATTEYRGKIISEGESFITTLGSGAIVNHGYSDGYVGVLNGQRVVSGSTGVNWSGIAQPGDYIALGATGVYDESVGYRIHSVTGTSGVVLAESYAGAGVTGMPYYIYRKDTPANGISNVVDRLPSYQVTDSTGTYVVDSSCDSCPIITYLSTQPLKTTMPVVRKQDPLVSVANDFVVGAQTKTNIRGRYDFKLSATESASYKLTPAAPRPHILYEFATSSGRRKVYQTYLFARSADGMISGSSDLTGRLYLMIVSGETCTGANNELSTYTSTDTVDLFELVGRPVVKAP